MDTKKRTPKARQPQGFFETNFLFCAVVASLVELTIQTHENQEDRLSQGCPRYCCPHWPDTPALLATGKGRGLA